MPRAKSLLLASRPTVLDCGAGVRLSGYHSRQEDAGRPEATTLVVLLHGWEGSAQSLYVLALGGHLFNLGYDVFRLNLRDHGGSHGLNPGLFHSCRLDEVVGAVARLQRIGAQPAETRRGDQRAKLLGAEIKLVIAQTHEVDADPIKERHDVCALKRHGQ